LVHSENDESVEMQIMLPMTQKGTKVYDAFGTYLFTSATEEIATALLESFDEALRICMIHPKKQELDHYDN
jgi:hypothetical protein